MIDLLLLLGSIVLVLHAGCETSWQLVTLITTNLDDMLRFAPLLFLKQLGFDSDVSYHL